MTALRELSAIPQRANVSVSAKLTVIVLMANPVRSTVDVAAATPPNVPPRLARAVLATKSTGLTVVVIREKSSKNAVSRAAPMEPATPETLVVTASVNPAPKIA
jgi:hypothetical protein